MTSSSQDIRETCRKIDSFVNKISCCEAKVRWISHREYLTAYIDRKQITTSLGERHYVTCVWSQPGVKEGPDTCECSQVSMVLRRVNEELPDECCNARCSVHCNKHIDSLLDRLSELVTILSCCLKK